MTRLIVKRENAYIGFPLPMNCYANNQLLCTVKNGEKVTVDIDKDFIDFKCSLPENPMSNIFSLCLQGKNSVLITVKQGAWKPLITVSDESLITEIRKPKGLIQEEKKLYTKDSFVPTKTVGGYFAINDTTQQWAIGRGIIPSFRNSTIYNYDDIIEFELIEDGESLTRGGLGRAAVGGLFFGRTGAIVGGVTGRRKTRQTCTMLFIKITINSIETPAEYIKLITTPTKKDTLTYRMEFRQAQEIISLLQIIVNQQENEENVNAKNENSQLSIADEIRNFKSLLDDGIITKEEFENKKKQLLEL